MAHEQKSSQVSRLAICISMRVRVGITCTSYSECKLQNRLSWFSVSDDSYSTDGYWHANTIDVLCSYVYAA